jgi:hypothetical protein
MPRVGNACFVLGIAFRLIKDKKANIEKLKSILTLL